MKTRQLTITCILIYWVSTSCIFNNSDPQKSLKWKFENFNKLKYDYTQLTESHAPFSTDEKMLNEVKGTLIVSVKENGKADLIFKEIQMTMFSLLENGDTNQVMSNSAPDFFIQDMDEVGNVDGKLNQQTELLAQILFPVSDKDLLQRKVIKLPVIIPFNMFGSVINVKGYNQVKLEAVNEENIASIVTSLDVAEFDIPEDADLNYECYLKGSSDYQFDLNQGIFKLANLEIFMVAKSILSNDKNETNDKSWSPDDAFRKTSLGMEMKTSIRLILKEME